jgi:hypothetical protein
LDDPGLVRTEKARLYPILIVEIHCDVVSKLLIALGSDDSYGDKNGILY